MKFKAKNTRSFSKIRDSEIQGNQTKIKDNEIEAANVCNMNRNE